LDFVKMEGLGNDFIVVDAPFAPDPAQIRRWCDRRFGVGADGVLEIGAVADDRIRMRYWNADGGPAEMCGNGLRCLAALALRRGWVGPEMIVETAMGDMPAQVLPDGRVRALVGRPQRSSDPLELHGVVVHPVSVGNPHAVVFVEDTVDVDVAGLGAAIETAPELAERTNVEFVAPTGLTSIRARIWERGVGETLASGTGATASVYAAVSNGLVAAPTLVALPGGTLQIELNGSEAWMVGPGNVVYEGVIAS
jgi:diaminopimelate epimerase